MSSKVPPVRLATGVYLEPGLDWASRALWLKIFTLFAIAVFVGVCVVVSEVRPAALVDGIPRMLGWMATAWPPYGQELDVIAYRAFETVAGCEDPGEHGQGFLAAVFFIAGKEDDVLAFAGAFFALVNHPIGSRG